MEHWGVGTFQNEEALDRLASLMERFSNKRQLSSALVELLSREPTEAPDAIGALVAAEIVSALTSRPSRDFPVDAKVWLAAMKGPFDHAIVGRALEAVARVRDSSRLAESYESVRPDWLDSLARLDNRLLRGPLSLGEWLGMVVKQPFTAGLEAAGLVLVTITALLGAYWLLGVAFLRALPEGTYPRFVLIAPFLMVAAGVFFALSPAFHALYRRRHAV